MKYLTGEDILFIHSEIIDQTSGIHGIRETELFLSIIEKPKMQFGGVELYKDIFTKTAIYCESLAMYHVFLTATNVLLSRSALDSFFLTALNFPRAIKKLKISY